MRLHQPALTPPLLSIFILSASALAYEILLLRLFSIIHWHHFASMIISIALLGYGISGSLITLFRDRLLPHYQQVFIANALLFGLSSLVCFIIVQHFPFNSLEILWDSSQWFQLLLSYLLLTLPFFFVANAVALSLMRFSERIPLLYGIDLIGAGLGVLLMVILLQNFSLNNVLRLLAVCGISAGLFSLRGLKQGQAQLNLALIVMCLIIVILAPYRWTDLRLSPYQGLSQALSVKGTTLLQSHSSAIARTDVVQSKQIPFRHAPGLSLSSPAGPPEQLAVFRDGDQMTTIDIVSSPTVLEYYDYMSTALPYKLHPSPQNVLILASTTGALVLQADKFEAQQIDVVEPDLHMSNLITDEFADYIGWSKLQHKVDIHNITSRGFAASAGLYDLVIMGPPSASSGGSAGVHAVAVNYDYTVEALQSYLQLLKPNGLLSLTLWTSTPARANIKLLATVVSAMKNIGIDQPGQHIAWIRSWNTATLLIKNSVLTATDIIAVRQFSASRGFDLAWLPDINPDEANRYSILQNPVFYQAAKALLQESDDSFIDNHLFRLQPASDNKPFFNFYFKGSSLNDLLSMPGQTGLSLIGVGYPTLLITLAQALAAALLLILGPLVFIRFNQKRKAVSRCRIIVYFMGIGLAYLFIELAFIQKFTLILSQPLYAVAVTLCAFLIFSGLGSLYIQHRMKTASETTLSNLLLGSVIGITLISIIYVLLLPQISQMLMALPEPARLSSAFILAAPLAFVMGMPFALGLTSLQQSSPELIPWAWGINGCASVLSAILAVLLAIEIGFNGVLISAAVLYIIAWFSWPHERFANQGSGQ